MAAVVAAAAMPASESLYRPRRIQPATPAWDDDGLKLYTVSASGQPVAEAPYRAELARQKAALGLDWARTAAFAIFHAGATQAYLVLCWWGQDNELRQHVLAQEDGRWVHDPRRYSVCVWDLEILWAERGYFLEHLYRERPSLRAYRRCQHRSEPAAGAARSHGAQEPG